MSATYFQKKKSHFLQNKAELNKPEQGPSQLVLINVEHCVAALWLAGVCCTESEELCKGTSDSPLTIRFQRYVIIS